MVRKERSKLTKKEREAGIIYVSQLQEKTGGYLKAHIITQNNNYMNSDNEIVYICNDDSEVFAIIEKLEDDKFFNPHCKKNLIKC